MRCPWCASLEDKVVDSRAAEDGGAIRRRRECLDCNRRFTTFERIEEVPLVVIKRNGQREAFERTKVLNGLRAATKNLPGTAQLVDSLASDLEEQMRVEGQEVSSDAIGRAVLERLRHLDGVAYVRFASVYKNFTDPAEFANEVRLFHEGTLTKTTAPKTSEDHGTEG